MRSQLRHISRLVSRTAAAGVAAALTAGMLSVPATAADFSGDRVEIIVPFGAGGGTDTWARFWAPYLSEHLPGEPTIVVRNVPGGGSTTGANQFQTRAEPDGLTLLGTSGSTQFPYLLGDPRVNYEYKDWNVIFASPTGGVAYVKPGLGVDGPEDIDKLREASLTYGSQGATSLDLVPLLAFEMLDLNMQAVFGMKGRSSGRLAFERGETNIDYQTSAAYLTNVTPIVENGEAVPLFSWGATDDEGNIVRDPSFPDLPSFPEFYEEATGERPSGPAWEAWKSFFIAGFPAQKMLFLPEGTPQDIVQAYRDAAAAATQDEGFVEDRKATLGNYKQIVGEPAERILRKAINVPDDARAWVREWLTEKYNVDL